MYSTKYEYRPKNVLVNWRDSAFLQDDKGNRAPDRTNYETKVSYVILMFCKYNDEC